MGNSSTTDTSQGTPSGGHDPKTNWTKTAAILSAAASAVAVLSWLGISGNSPSSSPSPSPSPAYSPTAISNPNTYATGSAPELNQSPALSAACQQAEAAVEEYKSAAGTTWASRADAATRAYNQLGAIMSSGEISQLIESDLFALVNDFRNLYLLSTEGGGSTYDETLSTTNSDAQHLWSDCDTG